MTQHLRAAALICALATLPLQSCAHASPSAKRSLSSGAGQEIQAPLDLAASEGIITLIGTNDTHGRFLTESTSAEDTDEGTLSSTQPERLGGAQWLAGYVSAIRGATNKRYSERGVTLLLDAGDAAQGTLISNSTEGLLAADVLNRLQYTAAIPGNHAFDFGPIDPDVDQCPIGANGCDPLAALKRFSEKLSCPLLGANVKLAANHAKTAPFLKDYTLVPFMGRNIAVIGLENAATPSTTYRANVQSLQFTSGIEETRKIVASLKTSGQADVFVIVTHNGDQPKETSLTDFIKTLNSSGGDPVVDAVIAGHTHRVEQGDQSGTPYVQSSWGGKYFGLIELVVRKDPTTGKLTVERDRTQKQAGIPIAPQAGTFMGEPVQADAAVASLLEAAEQKVRPIADQKIGTLTTALSDAGKRDADSEVGNFVVDVMRRAAKADIAVIGSGDVRIGITHPAGDSLTYNQLFEVLPKGLQLVKVQQLPLSMLLANLKLSIQSCGHRGALQTSGARIYFDRDCSRAVNGIDRDAKLISLIADDGRVLFPGANSPATVSVATTDFILTGGAGYTAFSKLITTADGRAKISTLGPLRPLMASQTQTMGSMSASDFQVGRFVNCLEVENASAPGCKLVK